MAVDLKRYRAGSQEQARAADLMALVPSGRTVALDVGARDGHISRMLASRFERVIALDVSRPDFQGEGINRVQGDVVRLAFPDHSIDVVFCAEVLEHIPEPFLQRACQELQRVSRYEAVIGVPYKQDTRVGRTTCQSCGQTNPPWGHVNSFDEKRLAQLFCPMRAVSIRLAGPAAPTTNRLACFFMDRAGNPWGTYEQDEPCIHCRAPLSSPLSRSAPRRLSASIAWALNHAQNAYRRPSPTWIHILFRK